MSKKYTLLYSTLVFIASEIIFKNLLFIIIRQKLNILGKNFLFNYRFKKLSFSYNKKYLNVYNSLSDMLLTIDSFDLVA